MIYSPINLLKKVSQLKKYWLLPTKLFSNYMHIMYILQVFEKLEADPVYKLSYFPS